MKKFIIPITVILIYLSFLFLMGQNAYIDPFDNLDSHITFYKVLAQSGKIFAPLNATIPAIMNGLPRVSFVSEFNVLTWLFYFFKAFNAYVINEFIMHFVAFFGMYLLLKRHFLKDENKNNLVLMGASLAFALLPFFPSRGIGIAGQPLLLYAFLNIRSKKFSLYDWLIVAIFPFYSFLVFSQLFVLFALTAIFLFDCIKNKKINVYSFLSLLVLAGLQACCEYRLIYDTFLNHSFVSHRAEFLALIEENPVKFAWKNFLSGAGQPWTKSFHSPFIIASFIIAAVVAHIKKINIKSLYFLMIAIISISVIYGVIVSPFALVINKYCSFFKTFQFQRLCSLLPILWYIVFGLSLSLISKKIKFGKIIVSLLLVAQVIFLFLSFSPIKNEFRDIFHIKHDNLTYRQYYSENLFNKIKLFIGEPVQNYRVVSLALAPSVSQYNGFYTLDAYINNYPLSYKHQFQKIIQPELDKNPGLGAFKIWGNDCFLFSNELDEANRNEIPLDKIKLHHFHFDYNAFKEIGGKYIFSRVEILNIKENHLIFKGVFTDNFSPYTIYLYKVY